VLRRVWPEMREGDRGGLRLMVSGAKEGVALWG